MNWFFLLKIPVDSLHTIVEQDAELERQRLIDNVVGLSITAVIAAIPAYLLIRYTYFKVKKEFRFKTRFSEYNHVDALVLLSMNVLRTNPDCFREKCIYLKEYVLYLYPRNKSFHESLKMAYGDIYRSESIVQWLNRFLEKDQRRDVVRFLVHMAAQDGIVALREKEEIIQIIDAFELVHDEWIVLIEDINKAFADKQNRWRKTHDTRVESYQDELIRKALLYFEMQRETLNEEGLRNRYRNLVKQYHPDSNPMATPEQHKALEIKFQELQLYYEELLKLLS